MAYLAHCSGIYKFGPKCFDVSGPVCSIIQLLFELHTAAAACSLLGAPLEISSDIGADGMLRIKSEVKNISIKINFYQS